MLRILRELLLSTKRDNTLWYEHMPKNGDVTLSFSYLDIRFFRIASVMGLPPSTANWTRSDRQLMVVFGAMHASLCATGSLFD